MTRGLKFLIIKVEGLYYLCSQNEGSDQLLGYRATDLRLCFRICKMQMFSKRLNSNKNQVMVIFAGTHVLRDPNWDWGNQDGRPICTET